MEYSVYLVSYGLSGDFAQFRPSSGCSYQRGDRVVVRSHQGMELGVVLCPATEEHGRFLSRTAMGDLLRLANEEDQQSLARLQKQSEAILEDAQQLARQLNLPLEVIDVEMLLDGRQVILHHLRSVECDFRALVSSIAKKHDVVVLMQNLAIPTGQMAGEDGGCGKPDCGKGEGGCSSCGSGGGGCSTGGCGTKTNKAEVAAYLTNLQHEKALSAPRTPLL